MLHNKEKKTRAIQLTVGVVSIFLQHHVTLYYTGFFLMKGKVFRITWIEFRPDYFPSVKNSSKNCLSKLVSSEGSPFDSELHWVDLFVQVMN